MLPTSDASQPTAPAGPLPGAAVSSSSPDLTGDTDGRSIPTLRVEELTVYRASLPAVRRVTFEVPTGSLGILGRNGAGKSTLLGGLVGILPSSGHIFMNGADISNMPSWKRARGGIAFVPQGRQVFAALTVEENLRLAELEQAGKGPKWDVSTLFPALARIRARPAGVLSGGEQQQVAIARSLLRRPTILFLDEPSEGLAPIIVGEIVEVLKHLQSSGLTLILAEQHHLIVSSLCDHFLVVRSGEIAGGGVAEPGAIERYYDVL
jgi:ABC-type branched-subunit amino acid transport system ATPase component